eukprot:gene15633-21741_t
MTIASPQPPASQSVSLPPSPTNEPADSAAPLICSGRRAGSACADGVVDGLANALEADFALTSHSCSSSAHTRRAPEQSGSQGSMEQLRNTHASQLNQESSVRKATNSSSKWLPRCKRTKETQGLIRENQFLIGMNLGNVNVIPFRRASTLYSHSPAELKDILTDSIHSLAAAGGNSLRVWLHSAGVTKNHFNLQMELSILPSRPMLLSDEPGLVTGLELEAVEDLKWLLAYCWSQSIKVLLTLWSHDLMAVRKLNPPENRDRVMHLITNKSASEAYIENALVPLVTYLRATFLDGMTNVTYADTLIGYEVFNEPEGISLDERLFHNYFYSAAHGTYEMENPSAYDAQGARQRDMRSMSFMEEEDNAAGFLFAKEDNWTAVYSGYYFLAGQGPEQLPCPCRFSRSSYVTPDNFTVWDPRIPDYHWFNQYMYKDVVFRANSEFTYLMPLIASCKVKTKSVPMAAIQRFINRACGAIKRADPKALCTVGAHSSSYITDADWLRTHPDVDQFMYGSYIGNRYSDSALSRAFLDPDTGGLLDADDLPDPLGSLDFSSPHAYPSHDHKLTTKIFSPFYRDASDFETATPILLGEFWSVTADGDPPGTYDKLSAESWTGLYLKGYAGGMGWALLDMFEEHGGDLDAVRTIVPHEIAEDMLLIISETSKMMKTISRDRR